MTTTNKCNKIFVGPEGSYVIAYDYNVRYAADHGHDLVLRYIGKGKEYYMTVPHEYIYSEGVLLPETHISQFNGPHKTFKYYKFKWQPDDDTRSKNPTEADKKGDSVTERPSTLF